MTWSRYVAIGDSFTEGMSDPDPQHEDRFRGWADLLAAQLAVQANAAGAPFAYANLAVRGRKLDDVVGAQLQAALDLKPDLVSVVGGGNDILRPTVDLDAIASRPATRSMRPTCSPSRSVTARMSSTFGGSPRFAIGGCGEMTAFTSPRRAIDG